jgi:hypothetical protein
MAIAGINFTKLTAERKAPLVGKININNNIIIADIKKSDFKLPNQESITIEFDFSAKYDPEIGRILVSGEVLFIEQPKKVDEIIAQWKKDKKLPDDILANIMNSLLTRCNVEAIILSREVGLPPTLNMPKVKVNKE